MLEAMNVLTIGLGVAVVVLAVAVVILLRKWKDAEGRLAVRKLIEKHSQPIKTTMYGELAEASLREARIQAKGGYIASAEKLFLKAREYRKKDQEALMNGEIF